MKHELELLRQFIHEGYCLHGSPVRIEGLVEPRKACDITGRRAGCLEAVYASQKCIRVPCLMAMFAKRYWWQRGRMTSYSGTEGGLLTVTGRNTTFRPGFIHVLPSNTFEEIEYEFVSFKAVKPHAIVGVTPAILHLLPNMDLRIPVPTSW